jgi:hypothetical protein
VCANIRLPMRGVAHQCVNGQRGTIALEGSIEQVNLRYSGLGWPVALSCLASLTRALFQLALHLGHVAGLDVRGGRLGVLGKRKLPLRGGQADAAGLLVEVAQVVVDGGVGLVALDGLAQVLLGQLVLPSLKYAQPSESR